MSGRTYLDHPGPIPLAHRGGAAESPENTLAAFRAAWQLGFRYLETDAHVTTDGVVVAFHDRDLGRVGSRRGRIGEHSWAELRDVRVGGEPIPRLDEVLESLPEARFSIDAKTDAVAGPLVDLLRRMGAMDRVCIGAFDDRRLTRVRRHADGRVATTLGPWAITRMRLAASGRIRYSPGHGDVLAVPPGWRRWRLVDQAFVAKAHSHGLAVHVWTVDDAEQMHHLLDLGVDGIFTDRPSTLKRVLGDRGQWH